MDHRVQTRIMSTERAPDGRDSGPAGGSARDAPNQTLALAAMLFAVSMTFIDQTIVSVAAPSIISELGLSSSGMQWVVNAYLLALAAFFALGGRLADLCNFAAAVGMAVFSTVLTHVTTDRVVDTLTSKGVPETAAREAGRDIAQAVTGHADDRAPSGTGEGARIMRDSMDGIRMDFAEANQWVFYGMAVVLAVAFLCALRHPGTRVTEEPAPARDVRAGT
jgi:MFS family permease